MPGDSCCKSTVPRVGILSFKKLRVTHVHENKVLQNIGVYCYLNLHITERTVIQEGN
jgi:hypothetical protein